MILVQAMLFAPWCAVEPGDPTVIHKVDMEGIPVRDYATAEHATAVCGAKVKLVELQWGHLRTRGTSHHRCAGCRPTRKAAA